MTIVFAGAMGHAPGWVAWPERAPKEQRDKLEAGTRRMRYALETARPEVLIMLTSEHWTNFFLDHVSAFCIGSGIMHTGPVEPWMRMEKISIPGAPHLAGQILDSAYAAGFEPSFSQDLLLDHGTFVPLAFLMPDCEIPVLPVFFNTLAPPQPSPARCHALGSLIGEVARASDKRIAIIATGGMSHDPGELRHGWIDTDFDRRFLDAIIGGEGESLAQLSISDLAAAGAGAVELIAWIALAGALGRMGGEVVAYEPVRAWATGMGIVQMSVVETCGDGPLRRTGPLGAEGMQ